VHWESFLALSFVTRFSKFPFAPPGFFAKGENYIIVSTLNIAPLFYGVELRKEGQPLFEAYSACRSSLFISRWDGSKGGKGGGGRNFLA
jgi:hypothetical protein